MWQVIIILLLSNLSFAQVKIDLEASGRHYQKLLKQTQIFTWDQMTAKDPLQEVLAAGQRNLQWLDHMNQFRDEAHKLRFSKPGGLKGIPIDQAITYGEKKLLQTKADLLRDLPPAIKSIVFEGAPLTDQPPLSDEEYILWGKKIDRLYSFAARWILMKPWLGYLEKEQQFDVRGYYFLRQIPNLIEQLNSWQQLDEVKKKNYRQWLSMICVNDLGLNGACEQKLQQAESHHQLPTFYHRYFSAAEKNWQQFFVINKFRKDVVWKKEQPNLMQIPFLNPNDLKVKNFLTDNIEDEFKNQFWNLKLHFVEVDQGTARIVFEPGVTPNVNALAGNIITMDANAPLDEWEVRWTIRHEYGHVLGLPDCYIEFYDRKIDEIVSYQMDVTNFMCSMAGQFQDRHYQELKRVYLR